MQIQTARTRRCALFGARRGALLLLLFAPAAALAQDAIAPPALPPVLAAVRAEEPITLDGRLDEADWARAPVASGFRQANPDQGEPAVLPAEVRVLFDDRFLYIGAFNRDPLGEAGLRVPDLRRDFNLQTHDQFGVVIDAVGDGRYATVFGVNPLGVQRDKQVTDGTGMDVEWNGLWHARTERSDSGWTVEMAIPWSTLRSPAAAAEGGAPAGEPAAWRVNFFRIAQRLGESSGWSPWPRAYSPYHLEYAGRLTGIEPPPPSRNVRIQPYVVARGDRSVTPLPGTESQQVERSFEPRFGGDLKWVIDPATVLDLTVNTDFAEADVDRQVVNLSRFNVFFPEQRPFFLENRSLFATASSPSVQPFFTRRIGLDAGGQPIPLHAGARFTRRTTGHSLGGLVVRQGAGLSATGSTFAVGRYQRNVGRQSRVGVLAASRWDEGREGAGAVHNTTLSADASLILTPALRSNLMVSGSLTGGAPGGDGVAATFWIGHSSNRGYLGWLQHYIGRGYDPRSGFVYARDLVLSSPAATRDLRPTWRPRSVRNFRVGTTANLYHGASDLAFRQAELVMTVLGVELRNSGFVRLLARPEWQRLEAPFTPLPGARIEPGRYQFTRLGVEAGSDPSARYNAQMDLRTGAFYDGTLHQLALSAAASPLPHAAFTAGWTATVLRGIGPEALDRTTHLVAPGVRLALDPRAQLTGFYQYNTATEQGSGNLRLSWEFRPLSFLHVVYNDRAGIDPQTGWLSPALPSERQLIVKLTYLGQL
jgi:hypothetical protein